MLLENLKKNILKINKIINSEINIVDNSGVVIHSTNKEKLGTKVLKEKELKTSDKIFIKSEYIYLNITFKYGENYIISMKGIDEQKEKYMQLISLFLNEDSDYVTKDEFIKDLLLEKVEKDKIEKFCKQYHLDLDNEYQVIVIKNHESQIEDVKNLFQEIYPNELIIKTNKNTLAFILNLRNEYEDDLGVQIYNTILSELLHESEIGIGTKVYDIKNLHNSYKEALLSIELGNKFFRHKKVYNYKDVIIPLLIKKTDIKYLKELLKEANANIEKIFKDSELLNTAIYFLENNLNISESARKLYIHRNTLHYRLNKIFNITGYDLRNFEDAMNFKAMMFIYKYLKI